MNRNGPLSLSALSQHGGSSFSQFVRQDLWAVRLRWSHEGGSHGGIRRRAELAHMLCSHNVMTSTILF